MEEPGDLKYYSHLSCANVIIKYSIGGIYAANISEITEQTKLLFHDLQRIARLAPKRHCISFAADMQSKVSCPLSKCSYFPREVRQQNLLWRSKRITRCETLQSLFPNARRESHWGKRRRLPPEGQWWSQNPKRKRGYCMSFDLLQFSVFFLCAPSLHKVSASADCVVPWCDKQMPTQSRQCRLQDTFRGVLFWTKFPIRAKLAQFETGTQFKHGCRSSRSGKARLEEVYIRRTRVM